MDKPLEASDLRSYAARMLTRVGIREITAENLSQAMHHTHIQENGLGHHPRTGNLAPSDSAGLIGGAPMPHKKTVTEFHAALIRAPWTCSSPTRRRPLRAPVSQPCAPMCPPPAGGW
ncbi:hypothetical protein [Streptomyces mobaraensis]|uniref:Uncharacterized protein n=1 Tax=Streptomyces mobaraensis TaxID=35621 RepID=A0A5N5W1E1_STRMB|nr:hypothetical protein [Streptomyces mobaraensis]KAB7835712.1 hypothetical protein FRZ00_26175 [Streptomyces mobaraensis]